MFFVHPICRSWPTEYGLRHGQRPVVQPPVSPAQPSAEPADKRGTADDHDARRSRYQAKMFSVTGKGRSISTFSFYA